MSAQTTTVSTQGSNVVPFEKPSASIVLVTPDMAKRWLDRNHINRNQRWNLVESYAHDMRKGQWTYAGEPIKFSATGRLLDGQHRLRAVVLAGVSVHFLVVRGLADDAQKVMDTGAKRTTADALRMERGTHAVAAAAGARLAIQLALGNIQHRTRPVISNAEVIGWLDDNPGFVEALPMVTPLFRRLPLSKGVLTLAGWRLRDIDPAAALEFWQQVQMPDGIGRDDPRAVLNRKLLDMRARRVNETPAYYLDLVYQAWNRWRRGQTAQQFRVARKSGGRIDITEPR